MQATRKQTDRAGGIVPRGRTMAHDEDGSTLERVRCLSRCGSRVPWSSGDAGRSPERRPAPTPQLRASSGAPLKATGFSPAGTSHSPFGCSSRRNPWRRQRGCLGCAGHRPQGRPSRPHQPMSRMAPQGAGSCSRSASASATQATGPSTSAPQDRSCSRRSSAMRYSSSTTRTSAARSEPSQGVRPADRAATSQAPIHRLDVGLCTRRGAPRYNMR
jgi:hypothetical protein